MVTASMAPTPYRNAEIENLDARFLREPCRQARNHVVKVCERGIGLAAVTAVFGERGFGDHIVGMRGHAEIRSSVAGHHARPQMGSVRM